MKKTAIEALFHQLEQSPEIIESAKKIAFIRAQMHPGITILRDKPTDYFQSSRHLANQLRTFSFQIKEELSKEYDLMIYLPTKSKDENLMNLGLIAKHLKENGTVIFSIENELGSDSFRKRVKELFGEIESISKFHCKVLIVKKNSDLNKTVMEEYYKLSTPSKIEGTELVSMPGVFSHGKIDDGSRILVNHLPKLHGKIADFGAGYGYLSHEILKNNHVEKIDLYENEKISLDCCKINLKEHKNVNYLWFDLAKEPVTESYSFIISNPPFHEGKKTSFGLALSFLDKAKIALKNSGTLVIVGKEHLPYQRELKARFKTSECIAKENGFCVWIGKK